MAWRRRHEQTDLAGNRAGGNGRGLDMTEYITVRGVVGTEVEAGLTNGGTQTANFRLASSERRLEKDQWVDKSTNWYRVEAYRYLAQNIVHSLKKGDRVIVTGKLRLRQWVREDGHQVTSPEIDAESIGHDLKWGTAKYARNVSRGSGAQSEGDAVARPAFPSDGEFRPEAQASAARPWDLGEGEPLEGEPQDEEYIAEEVDGPVRAAG
jgi:single-strand DNA-binding protein